MLFELDRVSLSRAGKPVLRELSARLPLGATCLAGPSGSGKSTILRLLDRLADPDSGTVRYRGEDVRERDPLQLRLEVGLVPQLPALLEGTVEDNIRFAAGSPTATPTSAGCSTSPGSTRASPGANRAGSRSASSSGRCSPGRWRSSPRRCSSTSRPRPSTRSPPGRSRRRLLELAARLEISLVLVTHDLDQARRMSEWLVRIEAGRAVEQGPTGEVLGAGIR